MSELKLDIKIDFHDSAEVESIFKMFNEQDEINIKDIAKEPPPGFSRIEDAPDLFWYIVKAKMYRNTIELKLEAPPSGSGGEIFLIGYILLVLNSLRVLW